MKSSIKLGKIWGIPIGLNISWFLIFGLITWSLSAGYFPQEYPQLSSLTHLILAVITSILFFGSVLAHELGHSFFAIRNNIPVKSITLFIFGGVAQIEREPETPGADFRIAIAGPITSIALAMLFGGLFVLDQSLPWLAAPSAYLARINLMLAVFNMIPGFPLDGGRVFRAILWKFTGNYSRATKIAAASGQIVAFGFFGLGALSIFKGQVMNGLWLSFIGWFLQNAASSANAQTNIQDALRGVTVAQAMTREQNLIHSLTPLSQVVQERVLGSGQHTFYITDGEVVIGLLTLPEITRIPRSLWRFKSVGQAMTPINRLVHVAPDMDLTDALRAMEGANQAQAPVMVGQQIIGTLTRERVLQYLHMKTQLRI